MKSVGKAILLAILSWQVQRLRRRNSFKIIAVVGSYGKTSTKSAIATVLKKQFRVQYQAGNYNDIITVPLVFFGETLPGLANVFAWIRLLLRNERQLNQTYPYDIVILELGVDGPGQMNQFARYLHVDMAVITAIAYEHMEYFGSLQAVAKEELAVAHFSDRLLINSDLCSTSYITTLAKPVMTYATGKKADYREKLIKSEEHIYKHDKKWLNISSYSSRSRAQRYCACAAAAVGDQYGIADTKIVTGIAAITPPSGRMQWLRGLRDSIILDETYNASPDAVKAALDVLYDLEAPQKIAVLGNMNELGTYAKQAHKEIGTYCDPAEVDLVITLGADANQYLAAAARERGCRVITCSNPYEAGSYLKRHIQDRSAILVKGSQNGVFAEEAVKMILADPQDSTLLVRQSTHWLKVKKKAWKHDPTTHQKNGHPPDQK